MLFLHLNMGCITEVARRKACTNGQHNFQYSFPMWITFWLCPTHASVPKSVNKSDLLPNFSQINISPHFSRLWHSRSASDFALSSAFGQTLLARSPLALRCLFRPPLNASNALPACCICSIPGYFDRKRFSLNVTRKYTLNIIPGKKAKGINWILNISIDKINKSIKIFFSSVHRILIL